MQQKPEICLKKSECYEFLSEFSRFSKKWIEDCFWIVRKMNSWTTLNRVATCEGNVREEIKFSPGQGTVQEFEKMSRNFGHLIHVRNCQEILLCHVREFSQNFVMIFYYKLKLPSCHKGSTWVVFV